ncbi:hypothetical protein O3P69_010456 [Scylla paramamosain]|uniref:AN1-type zinc finger protein 4 n=1 Tax=Scylla paramamosain TaxID=85552 RepID=A0AAW0TTE4_SCYPA
MRGAGSGRKQEHSPEDEGFQNSSRRPSDAEDEESVSTMMSETPPQLSHREPGDMLEVYADGDFEDGEEEEEEEEEDALELVWDTAASLKDLLYRTQGIHPSHQHLILRDRELVDDACLIDQQVVDGSTLRLVLAIRGGPINARRLPTHEDLLLRDITDHFENARWRKKGEKKELSVKEGKRKRIKSEILEGGGGQTFTFLVFHDDENMNVNVYRVMENPDGSYSPLNESFSGANGRGGAEEASVLKTQLTEEEKRTMARMADLRTEMDKLRLRNKKKKDKRKAMVSSTHTSLNSSLRSVTGRLEETLTPRLDLTDIAGGGAAHTTPRKRSAVKRLAGVRRGSRPTTQERLEIMKSSHGRPTLRELPTANPPVPVDFSRRKPLEAIRPQLIGGRLEAVEEMLGRGESSPEQGGRHSRAATGRQQEAWPNRDAPNPPLYMLPEVVSSGKHKRWDQDRLNHSHNQELLRPVRHTAGRRPKTSPEVLERRPGTLPDAVGERVLLRGTDDRLRELCSILEPSRGDSRHSQRQDSPPASTALPPLSMSHSFTGIGPPPRTHRSNSVSGALVTSGSREQRDALRGLMQSQGGGGASRPNSGRMPPPPAVLPPVTPKRRKNRRKPRCEKCSRRLGVSSTYECRCGGLFCAQHRYAETHACSFDYRTAGRAMLAMANPLVAPNRVPKI